jgi:hypothetical protein
MLRRVGGTRRRAHSGLHAVTILSMSSAPYRLGTSPELSTLLTSSSMPSSTIWVSESSSTTERSSTPARSRQRLRSSCHSALP